MSLRDHFRPPVSKKSSWEGFHAMWPTCIVQHLRNELPLVSSPSRTFTEPSWRSTRGTGIGQGAANRGVGRKR